MEARSTPSSAPLSEKHILIVEDEPLLAMYYASLLQDAGACVAGTCATVREALKLLEAADGTPGIDAAIVDFVLADRNSAPLQTELKRRHIPFVVISAYPRPLVRTEAAEHILQKPVTAALLYRALAEADNH
jgi:CheY-like chemotaxis protein